MRRPELGPSTVIKHSVEIGGHQTSVSLEPEFWNDLGRIATAFGVGRSYLINNIARDYWNGEGQFSAALRQFVLDWWELQIQVRR